MTITPATLELASGDAPAWAVTDPDGREHAVYIAGDLGNDYPDGAGYGDAPGVPAALRALADHLES